MLRIEPQSSTPSLRRRHEEKPQPRTTLNLVPGDCYVDEDADDVDYCLNMR